MNRKNTKYTYKTILIIVFILSNISLFSQNIFSTYFENASMRVDNIFSGNSHTSSLYFKKIKKEMYWGGSLLNLIDTFNYGGYKAEIYDSASGKLIYSRGFSTLFEEWQTTEEAKNISKSFYQSITFPYPKKTIRFEIHERDTLNIFHLKYTQFINPSSFYIIQEKPYDFRVKKIHYSGNPNEKLDILFLAEGYKRSEMTKFNTDVINFSEYLFSVSPYREYKNKINIWSIQSWSEESGSDIPGINEWKNTVLNTSFYSLETERYIMTEDYEKVRDIASLAPYDQIVIIANTPKYGGGGIYNYYSVVTNQSSIAKIVCVHELGHSFGGLGDEYYSSAVSYQNFYNLHCEPWEPNLTTLVDFNSKWKNMVNIETPIPTPDSTSFKSVIGAFEGAGYSATGIYRSFQNCRMFSNEAIDFCPICKDALIQLILFHSK